MLNYNSFENNYQYNKVFMHVKNNFNISNLYNKTQIINSFLKTNKNLKNKKIKNNILDSQTLKAMIDFDNQITDKNM